MTLYLFTLENKYVVHDEMRMSDSVDLFVMWRILLWQQRNIQSIEICSLLCQDWSMTWEIPASISYIMTKIWRWQSEAKHIYHESCAFVTNNLISSCRPQSSDYVWNMIRWNREWLPATDNNREPLNMICMLLNNISSSLSLFFFRKHIISTVYSNIIYSYDCLFVLSFWHIQINDCLIFFNTLYPFLIAVHTALSW